MCVALGRVALSHLFFADDAVIFCKAKEDKVHEVMDVLKCYAEAFGQVINRDKSSLHFRANCSRQRRKRLVLVPILRVERILVTLTFDHRRRWSLRGEALEGRINGWVKQFISPVEREVLIKLAAMALPNCAMPYFKLPVDLCKELELAIAKFWWKGNRDRSGMHWLSWQKMKRRKNIGGLGFRDLLSFNLAHLAKIGWRILLNPKSLFGQILKAKYFPDRPFIKAKQGRRSSWGWKGIIQGRRILERGLR